MVTHKYGIKFITPKHISGYMEIRSGWLIDPMTGQPKEFDSMQKAKHYGELSFDIKPKTGEGYLRNRWYVPHTAVRLKE